MADKHMCIICDGHMNMPFRFYLKMIGVIGTVIFPVVNCSIDGLHQHGVVLLILWEDLWGPA